jgi:hypothetical protein
VDHQTRWTDDGAVRRLASQLTELTLELLDTTSVASALRRIVFAVTEVISGADLVSVTLRRPDGEFHTPAQTDPLAGQLDQLQYDFGEGPCVEAARGGGAAVAVSADLSTETAWPKFAPAAAAHGFASIVSTALLPDSGQPGVSGALNIYSRRTGGLTETDRAVALLLAAHVSLVLGGAQAANLRRAIESRDVIGQAKGILMQRRDISADEAFGILRKASQDLNVKLADLARLLSARHADLPPELGTWMDRNS